MMKNRIYISATFFLIFILGNSCEPNSGGNDIASLLEGKWAVSETSTLFKAAKDAYDVYITISEIDSTNIYISNFYGIGATYDVRATISGLNLTIPSQTVNGDDFTGSGIIAKNYKTITWKYKVAFESGDVDTVNAVYQKIE